MAEELASAASEDRRPGASAYLLTVVLLLAAGAAGFLYFWLHPRRVSEPIAISHEKTVHVFQASRVRRRLAVTAYGTSRASRQWTAIAEVGGSVVSMHPFFEPGEVLPESALVAQIDPTEYERAVALREAEVRASREELNELDQHEVNLKEIAKLQERLVQYAEEERERLGKLFAENASSRSQLEETECAYVGELANLQMIRNDLVLVPVRRRLLEASLDVAEARLAGERRQLEKCSVRLPFPGRCVSKWVDVRQCVGVGDRLGAFQSLDKAEVVVMLEMRKLFSLFPRGIVASGPETIGRFDPEASLWRRTVIPAEVRWNLAPQPQIWRGRLARLEGALDPATRTIPAIIEVPDPVQDVKPGIPQPLLPGAFCRVTLYGTTVSDVVVIPRGCVRETPRADLDLAADDGEKHDHNSGDASGVAHVVYLLRKTSDSPDTGGATWAPGRILHGALHVAQVSVLAMEDDAAVIDEGIEEGDLVIRTDLADLFPASEGMRLKGCLQENPVGLRDESGPLDDILAEKTPAPARRADAGVHGRRPSLETAAREQDSPE